MREAASIDDLRQAADVLLASATDYPRCSHYLDYQTCRFAAKSLRDAFVLRCEWAIAAG